MLQALYVWKRGEYWQSTCSLISFKTYFFEVHIRGSMVMPYWIKDMLIYRWGCKGAKCIKKIRRATPARIVWTIWNARNRRCFEERVVTMHTLKHRSLGLFGPLVEIEFWLFCCCTGSITFCNVHHQLSAWLTKWRICTSLAKKNY